MLAAGALCKQGKFRKLGGVGLAILFAAWMLEFIVPTSRIITWGIVAVGLGLIMANVLFDYRRVGEALASRRGLFGIGTGVGLSLVVAVLLLVNLISTNVFHRFDFTGLAQFTLTSQTKEALAELVGEEHKVEAVSFFSDPSPNVAGSAETFRVNNFGYNLLLEYTNFTDVLSIRREDPELRPDLIRQYLGQGPLVQLASRFGVVVFNGSEGQMIVLGPQIQAEAENAFTSAILQETGKRQRLVYFLTGHGEASIARDYSAARKGLRDNLFQVAEWNLSEIDAMPKGASTFVIAGPQLKLNKDEIALIDDYLRQGGSLLLLLNPNPQAELRELISSWWMSIEDGVVVDPEAHVAPNYDVPLVGSDRNQYKWATFIFPALLLFTRTPTNPMRLPSCRWHGQQQRRGLRMVCWVAMIHRLTKLLMY